MNYFKINIKIFPININYMNFFFFFVIMQVIIFHFPNPDQVINLSYTSVSSLTLKFDHF